MCSNTGLKRRLDDDGAIAPSTFAKCTREELKETCKDYNLEVCSTAKRGRDPTKDDYSAALLVHVGLLLLAMKYLVDVPRSLKIGCALERLEELAPWGLVASE